MSLFSSAPFTVGNRVIRTKTGSTGVVVTVQNHGVVYCATVKYDAGEYGGTSQKSFCSSLELSTLRFREDIVVSPDDKTLSGDLYNVFTTDVFETVAAIPCKAVQGVATIVETVARAPGR